jgi:hypothetical protein
MWDVVTRVRRQRLKQICTIRVTDDQGSQARFSYVSWLAAELVGPEKGNCVAVSWLQGLLALKRAVVRSG